MESELILLFVAVTVIILVVDVAILIRESLEGRKTAVDGENE